MPKRRDSRTARVAVPIAHGVLAGAAGTTVMTATAHLHRWVYARRHGIEVSQIDRIIDYDDSEYVITAASTVLGSVLGWRPRTPAARSALFAMVHWGYGSAVGAGHLGLHRLIGREPAAGLAFFAGCQVMALGLFPVLGGTPVPWRWERDLLVTSIVQHGIYAGVVAAVNAAQRGG